MMKKVLSITASTLIVAGSVSAPAQAEDVFSRLSVRAAGHYDQATNERGAFATRNTVVAAPGAVGETFFVEPDYEWDYTLGLEYMLPNSDNSSLLFDYDHYNASDNKRVTGPAAGAGQLASVLNAGIPNPLQVDGDLNVKDHTFRLGARRVLDFGDRFDVQLGGYGEYSKVERHHTIIEVAAAGASRSYRANDESNGWGPSFDMYGRWYPMGRHSCYSVLAGVEAAFLYGDSVHNVRVTDETGAFPAGANTLNNENRADLNHVFTRLGSTVALTYARPVNDSWKFGLRAGARWINYANAFKNASGLSAGRTDYGRWGPFLEVRVGGVDSPM
ncbi:MAG: Lpg1974 family pore-forming outer membrane protein [Gammaproteobacteria bacterium]